jgi:hypothetical protein
VTLDLNRQTWATHDHATPDEKHRAARYVASQADDAADCRQLLDALGLLPKRLVVEHGMPGYRAGCRCPVCRKANSERLHRQRKRTSPPTTTTTDTPGNTTGGKQ